MKNRYFRRPRVAVLALATLLAVPGLSLAAERDKVMELIEVTRVEQSFTQMQQMLGNSFEQAFQQQAAQRGLEGEALQQAQERMQVVKRNIQESLAWDRFEQEVAGIYQEQLTDAEVDAAVAFYRTPEGASMLNKQPALMQATMELGQKKAQEMMPQLQAELQSLLPPPPGGAAPVPPPQG